MNRKTKAVLIPCLLAALGSWAFAGLEGSKHDFSNAPWSGGETCGVCHTPHQAEPPKAAPLWDPGADLAKRFGSASQAKPGSGSTSCLRCHDGTVARETFNVPREPRPVFRSNLEYFSAAHGGSNHPVGVEYPNIRKGYRPSSVVIAKGAVRLPENRVECVSCHDPHDAAGIDRMLVMSNARSALCLTCHQK